MTWRQEMPVPSSEESKIALQSRLGLSPSKYIRNRSGKLRTGRGPASNLERIFRSERRFINLLSKTLESHSGEALDSDGHHRFSGTYPIDRLLERLLSHPFCLSRVDSGIVIEIHSLPRSPRLEFTNVVHTGRFITY